MKNFPRLCPMRALEKKGPMVCILFDLNLLQTSWLHATTFSSLHTNKSQTKNSFLTNEIDAVYNVTSALGRKSVKCSVLVSLTCQSLKIILRLSMQEKTQLHTLKPSFHFSVRQKKILLAIDQKILHQIRMCGLYKRWQNDTGSECNSKPYHTGQNFSGLN